MAVAGGSAGAGAAAGALAGGAVTLEGAGELLVFELPVCALVLLALLVPDPDVAEMLEFVPVDAFAEKDLEEPPQPTAEIIAIAIALNVIKVLK